ncbi:nitrogen regulatory protein P-II [Syntrophobotulus glycolicus DSM 8271]|uniref:Nitrogen regulatory protein P-II n=1 Tax=Syntrophobotulus glycolicus (strain DSM 8271 / FlGlyR) TaxID=645991 RepID=F0SX92_SYNGF|nr:P-II family nitrogen regulator [Syntrophobotulus glycolicus]ADY56952.1 nitrogen regulatory protein P-II [Syntrophobotulus glycolicus DSM 8271]
MKKIEAVIRPNKLEEVEKALAEMGVSGITISQVLGWGRQKGSTTEIYRGKEFKTRLLNKIKLETVVPEEDSQKVKELIMKIAGTGNVGDGVIWISPVEELTRIRTGEQEK